jgi:CHAD domain-containing protein
MQSLSSHLAAYVHAVYSQIPGVRDGSPDAIHDARVAIRRIRALLPILKLRHDRLDVSDATSALRAVGRPLGRARDLDVAIEICEVVERDAPHIATAAADLKRQLRAEAALVHRRLIKKLDQVPLEDLEDLLDRIPRPGAIGLLGARRRDARAIAAFARQQSKVARGAIHRASGVYFPRRSHSARVEIRKLRYLLELTPPGPSTSHQIKQLKRTQDVLGGLHDREVLRARIADHAPSSSVGRRELATLSGHLEAEAHALFRQYLGYRAAVGEVCDAAELYRPPHGHPHLTSQAVIAGAAIAALPVAMALLGRESRFTQVPVLRLASKGK